MRDWLWSGSSLVLASSNFDLVQSAYRKRHSTETALLKIVNDIYEGCHCHQSTILVASDQSAAPDCVDHSTTSTSLHFWSYGSCTQLAEVIPAFKILIHPVARVLFQHIGCRDQSATRLTSAFLTVHCATVSSFSVTLYHLITAVVTLLLLLNVH